MSSILTNSPLMDLKTSPSSLYERADNGVVIPCLAKTFMVPYTLRILL